MARRVADVIAADRGVTLTGVSPPAATARAGNDEIYLRRNLSAVLRDFFCVFDFARAGAGLGSRFGGGGGWWIGPMMGGGFGGGGLAAVGAEVEVVADSGDLAEDR